MRCSIILDQNELPDDVQKLDKDEPLDGRTPEAGCQSIDEGAVELISGTFEPDDAAGGHEDGQGPML
jgi:hypothetical protein